MTEHNQHHFQSPGESAPQAPHSLLPALLARLGLNGSARVLDILSESLEKATLNPVWIERATAVEALASLHDQQSLERLVAALHDEDESVRACAARVLGKRENVADSSVIEQLEAALHDPAWHVRETAVYALGMMQSFASLLALKAVLDDEDAQVRLAAAQVIERLESISRNQLQENVTEDTIPVTKLDGVSSGIWPQWMRRPVASPVHRTHPEHERELPVIEETQDIGGQSTPATGTTIETPQKHVSTHPIRLHRPWLRVLEQVMAAILVLGIAISWFAITHLSHLSSGTPTVFNDANARPLGAPTYTIQGNLSYLAQWSNDGHTLFSLQVDTQKQALKVYALDAATGHTTIYPVLDSSWLPALHHFTIDMVGHYLVALRQQGSNHATMEIWDITGQRAITTQTVPASMAGNGQVVSPLLVSADVEQKFAMLAPDGTITIWNLASGQKLVTLDGKAPYSTGIPPLIKWYNHDQNLLVLARSNANGAFMPSAPEAWNTATGALLFNLKDTHMMYLDASVSPDGQYMALSSRQQQSTNSSNGTLTPDTLEIIDAHSGQVLRTYHLDVSGGTGVSAIWLPDSQHLLTQFASVNNATGLEKVQIRIWNAFTGQTTFETSSSGTELVSTTPDGQYLIRSGANSRSMQIWQTSSGRFIATLITPGIYPDPLSFSDINNQYILIGSKSNFDIWDIATGKLLYKYHGFTPFTVAGAGGSNVFWSPGGKYLTMIAWKTSLMGTGSDNGVVTIWRMP